MNLKRRFLLIDAPLVVLLAALVATCVGSVAIRRMSESGSSGSVDRG
jgi:hypothetical protein